MSATQAFGRQRRGYDVLLLLGLVGKKPAYRDKGEPTICAVANRDIVDREGRITGNLTLALELLISGYVQIFRSFFITVASSGQRLENSTVSWIKSGTKDRSTVR